MRSDVLHVVSVVRSWMRERRWSVRLQTQLVSGLFFLPFLGPAALHFSGCASLFEASCNLDKPEEEEGKKRGERKRVITED